MLKVNKTQHLNMIINRIQTGLIFLEYVPSLNSDGWDVMNNKYGFSCLSNGDVNYLK